MSLKSVRLPKYRHHKGSGQAFVQVKEQRHYLGKYNSEESRERYRRFVAELVASHTAGRTISSGRPGEGPTVVELAAAYWQFAQEYYVKDGRPTDHLCTVRVAMRLLRQLYGREPAAEFGPLALQATQQKLVGAGKARTYINDVCGVIRRAFRWAASQEIVPVTTYQALTTVSGLKKGRTAAREAEPVTPVVDGVVDATLPHLPSIVADMVRVQRLTGARPGEICLIRPCDVDRSGDVWIYRPKSHKVEHHDRERIVFIGPKAQAVLRPYLARPSDSYCFSPQESIRQFRAEQRARRKTEVQPSQKDRRKSRLKRQPGDHYTKDSYNRAVRRVCDREGIPRWHPNQLRHSVATEIRRQFGLEAAQVALGHARADVTQVYAQRDMALAEEVMRKIG